MLKENINLIYKQYMTLPINEIEKYFNEQAKKYNCSVSEIKKEMENYVQKSGIQECQKYLDRKDEIKNSNYKHVKIINEILDRMKKEEDIDFSIFGSISFLENYVNKYIEIYPDKKEEVEKLLKKMQQYFYVDKLKYNKKKYFSPNHDRMIELKITSKYIFEIIDIINCKTDDEAITYMRNLQLTEKDFKNNISRFNARFINSQKYIPRLIELFNKYQKFISSNNTELISRLDSRKEYLEYVTQVVSKLIESGYSIEEFCHYYLEFDIVQVEKCIKQFFNNKIRDIKLLKERNSKEEFIEQLKYISYKIENENYDCIDYYMDTKLNFNDFLNVIKKYGFYSTKITIFAAENKRRTTPIIKDIELNGSRIIKNRIITKEEKEAVFIFLKENEIPINMSTYKTALNRYLEGTLNIENKKVLKYNK